MHDCPRSDESDSLYSCSNTVFLRSLGAFRLRSACHIQFFSILDSWVDGLWPVEHTAGTWALRGFPGEHAYCRQGWAAQTVSCYGLRWKPVHQLLPSEGRDQPGKVHWGYTIKPLPCSEKSGHISMSTLSYAIWSVPGLFRSLWGLLTHPMQGPIYSGSKVATKWLLYILYVVLWDDCNCKFALLCTLTCSCAFDSCGVIGFLEGWAVAQCAGQIGDHDSEVGPI